MRILVVDDDSSFASLLADELKNLGYEVALALDGEEAWRQYRSFRPNVLLTDWMMPCVDGLELTRMIRAENRQEYTYIIFLTSLYGKGSFLEAMESGADDVITKPFDMEQLVARFRVAERIISLQREVKQLQGLLPICSYCKKIRDEENWLPIEEFIKDQTDAVFSHAICPTCYEEYVKPVLAKFKNKPDKKFALAS